MVGDMPKAIISASRRTDIPAFFAEWFMERIRAGHCEVANPYRPSQVRRADLRPESVAGIVFWTRHAAPLLQHLPTLDEAGYTYYFLYSLLGYPRRLEAASPDREVAIRTIRELADRVGRERVSWRYDPLILDDELTESWHRHHFESLLERLSGSVDRVIVSVIDPYRKTQAGIGKQDASPVRYDVDAYVELLVELSRMASHAGLPMQSCCEPALEVPGIVPRACIDASRIAALSGHPVEGHPHKLRPGCLCDRSIDIGTNNTCRFGCRYCYATRRPATDVAPQVTAREDTRPPTR
jgi:hypothetical protein